MPTTLTNTFFDSFEGVMSEKFVQINNNENN
jgi:hypothetical protein